MQKPALERERRDLHTAFPKRKMENSVKLSSHTKFFNGKPKLI